jgi:hypothetical protein
MSSDLDDPNYWVKRASDSREIAKHVGDKEMESILENIAKSYERIAERVRRSTVGGWES